jgi:hypothetical protein
MTAAGWGARIRAVLLRLLLFGGVWDGGHYIRKNGTAMIFFG